MKNDDGRPLTALIVEDVDWIRSSMKGAVELEGYRVEQAANDEEAFEVLGRELIELILTEEEVPTFDRLMARLREHSTLSTVPVVIINPDAEDGARFGDAYLLTDYAHISSLLASLRR
jgi:DNA-binding response OmpR family regulator